VNKRITGTKEVDELPEWVKLVQECIEIKKKDEVKKESEESNHNHLALTTGLYELVLNRIRELEDKSNLKSNIIRFPDVFRKLCASFQITKEQAWELLFLFGDLGLLEIVPYQGIRLKAKSSFNSVERI
jgi:predicted nuclease with TOPRIM domain